MYFLENSVIGLRVLELNDIKSGYGRWFQDEQVCRFNSHHRFPYTEEDLADYIRSAQNQKQMVFAMELLELKKHIGNISLQDIDYVNRSAEIAYIIGEKEYWGKGYAQQASILLLDHAFYQLGLERVSFGTSEENTAMQRLGDKLGFVKEGVKRKAFYKNGRFCDIYEYGLLKEDWMHEKMH